MNNLFSKFINKIKEIINKNNTKDESNNRILNLKKDRIALVTGSGGLKGAIALGVYKYMKEIDILDSVDCYVGTSIGSINTAGLLSMSLDELISLWQNIRKEDIYNGDLYNSDSSINEFLQNQEYLNILKNQDTIEDLTIVILGLINQLNGKGCLDVTPLRKFLSSNLDTSKIINNEKDFAICTLNLTERKQIVYTKENLTEDKIVDAIMKSSAAFPVFPLIEDDGCKFIDGGFYPSRHNAQVAFDTLKADKAIVIDFNEKEDETVTKDENIIYMHGSKGNFLDVDQIQEKIDFGYDLAVKAFSNVTIIR